MVTLSSLHGAQPRAVELLQAAIGSGRLHHAYLLAGPPEAGAAELARALTASLVCREPRGTDGCGECAACRKLASGNHPDVLQLSPDEKGKIGIDDVRELGRRLSLRAVEAATRVAVIDQADATLPAAQNALLKTLEEPPGSTCFLLCTSRLRSLLPTVRSRCQTVYLVPSPKLGAWRTLVAEGIEPELARPIAALVGTDAVRAQALVEQGAAEILAGLRRALAPGAGLDAILEVAAELGAARERADLGLTLLEVELRDRLASAHGATGESLYLELAPVAAIPTARLAAAAARLAELRRLQALHVNRTLALEAVLLELTGRGHEGERTRAAAARRRT